jgi:hypothetical protein
MGYWTYIEIDTGRRMHQVEEVGNYTSNVAPMWRKAMPETDGIAGLHEMKCSEAAPILRAGAVRMRELRDELEQLEPANGWGSYTGAVDFVERCARACEEHPAATFTVSC